MLGSTGNKYVVTLSDDKHSCKCMDFRIRRRECKHIKLVLQQLGVAKHPEDWHQVGLGFSIYFQPFKLCVRLRECKHTKLVMQQLSVAKKPVGWHQACLFGETGTPLLQGNGKCAGLLLQFRCVSKPS